MPGRQSLPHAIPDWVDSSAEVWFVTICCHERGGQQLTAPQVASAILGSVEHRYGLRQWYPHLFLLMPDHCHALLSFPGDQSHAKVIRDWKRWVAAQCHITWQRDFFDHRLRGDGSFTAKAAYIRENPVRAGLVARAEDWDYVWDVGGRLGDGVPKGQQVGTLGEPPLPFFSKDCVAVLKKTDCAQVPRKRD